MAPVAKGLILIADDDVAAVAVVRERLVAAGYEVVVVADGEAAMAELHRVELDVALVALTLPGRGGLDVLSAAHHLSPETEVIILAHQAQLATALECIRRGAFDLLARPLDVRPTRIAPLSGDLELARDIGEVDEDRGIGIAEPDDIQ